MRTRPCPLGAAPGRLAGRARVLGCQLRRAWERAGEQPSLPPARTAPHQTNIPKARRTTGCHGRKASGRHSDPSVRFETAEADLDDLRARVAATRFPEKETVEDHSQGAPLATIQALARYWATEYDWRKCEEN